MKATLAAYDGQFGYGGNFEHERKALVATIKRRYKDADAEKMSNVDADDLAHADEEYKDWLQEKHEERMQMNQYQADLAVLRARIEELLLERELIERKLRLNEEVIRFARSEMRLS